jgi:(1->4)-alpha-D-glucan 1-alpha-D-glucosylmutase
VTCELRTRLHSYAEKAIREAGLYTCWDQPDAGFESAIHSWLDAVIDGPVAAGLTGLLARLDEHARSDSLGQKLLALTVPGVPDVYQGTELWEDSLVDPDNRRPVDYRVRRAALAALRHPKIRVVAAALHLRRDRPDDFTDGNYTPVLPTGAAAEHLVAFRRGAGVLAAVCRHTVRLADTGWGGTALTLPEGIWTDRLDGRRWTGAVAAAELFSDLPVVLLERTGTTGAGRPATAGEDG